jgi:hypothetical protein
VTTQPTDPTPDLTPAPKADVAAGRKLHDALHGKDDPTTETPTGSVAAGRKLFKTAPATPSWAFNS